MCLSENVKKFRLKKNLTQEQLAAKLGISAQAVSKWETSETYPDGALLVPLANALSVSLDELFGNDAVSMPDLSRRVIALFDQTDSDNHFQLARDICWQIERGLFNCRMEIEKGYDPNEIKNQHNASYILQDNGFTMVSNGREPFFAVFPQPEDGFGHFLKDRQKLQEIFSALSHEDTMNALIWLYHKAENDIFEDVVLASACGIGDERIAGVIEELSLLCVVQKQQITINNQRRTLLYLHPTHNLIALFLIAREIGYQGAYSLQMHWRSTPFFQK